MFSCTSLSPTGELRQELRYVRHQAGVTETDLRRLKNREQGLEQELIKRGVGIRE